MANTKIESDVGGPEYKMKFSPQKTESPPPKPPRRRYSDQLSIPTLGNYSLSKKQTEVQRGDSILRKHSPKPAYLSLPTNLSSDVLTECDDSSNYFSQTFNQPGYIKNSTQNDYLTQLNFCDGCLKNACSSNHFCYSAKQSVIRKNSLSKHHDNDVPCVVDKYSLSKNKVFLTWNYKNHCFKSLNKRYHSDPAISHNMLKENGMKFNLQLPCDATARQSKQSNDAIDYCSCCKKSYLIMQEIRIMKQMNEKLWQNLCSVQSHLENVRKKVNDECTDTSLSISDLLSSIYYAQKAKDSAMEERLKIVLEERDTAFNELDDLFHILTRKCFLEDDDEKEVDKDMKDLLSELENSLNPSGLLRCQRLLLAQIHKWQNSKQVYKSQELRQAVIERDNALEKVTKLEEEIKKLKMCYDLWHSDNKHWESTMFDILNQVLQQRDSVFPKDGNDLEIGNIIYRSSMAKKLNSVEQSVSLFEPKSVTVDSVKANLPTHFNDYIQQQSINSTDEVRQLKDEILFLNKALGCERRKREESEVKCLRLERLIAVLRKKLNGQNIGVPV